MTSDAKRKTLAWVAGVICLTVILAMILPQLELRPGVPLPAPAGNNGKAPPGQVQPELAISIDAFWKAILGILLVAGTVYNVYRLLKGGDWKWKEILRSLLYLTMLLAVVVAVLLVMSGMQFTVQPPQEVLPPPPTVEVHGPPLGPVSPGLLWLICLGLAGMVIGLGLWLVFRSPAKTDPVKLEAERALQALKTGTDLKDVIVHCYWQMTQVLKQEQGVEMEAGMTTREFERLLKARGVPPAPVHQLTLLFETVRYGHRSPGPDAERQAVDSLTAIVRHSQTRR